MTNNQNLCLFLQHVSLDFLQLRDVLVKNVPEEEWACRLLPLLIGHCSMYFNEQRKV